MISSDDLDLVNWQNGNYCLLFSVVCYTQNACRYWYYDFSETDHSALWGAGGWRIINIRMSILVFKVALYGQLFLFR